MTFTKLRDRTVLGLEGSTILQRASEYIYEAELDMCMRAKCYEKEHFNLMVDPDNVHTVDLPDDFLEMVTDPEWRSVPIMYDPKQNPSIFRKSDGTWYTGTPFGYFLRNKKLFLFPEPATYVGDYKLAVWYVAKPREDHTAESEVTKITCFAESTLDGAEYFYISSLTVDYYVWIDIDNGSDDPAVSGRTGIEVDVSSDDSATAVATAVKTALDAIATLTATSSGAVVTCTVDSTGTVKSETLDVSTDFIFNVTTEGHAEVLSPVFDAEYHQYLVAFARSQVLLDDGRIREANEQLAIYNSNVEMVKRHFKSRSSGNVGRLIDRGGGPIKSGYSRSGGPRGGRVKEVSVSSS